MLETDIMANHARNLRFIKDEVANVRVLFMVLFEFFSNYMDNCTSLSSALGRLLCVDLSILTC